MITLQTYLIAKMKHQLLILLPQMKQSARNVTMMIMMFVTHLISKRQYKERVNIVMMTRRTMKMSVLSHCQCLTPQWAVHHQRQQRQTTVKHCYREKVKHSLHMYNKINVYHVEVRSDIIPQKLNNMNTLDLS